MTGVNVKDVIRRLIVERGAITNREVVERTGTTRQAVHRHLRDLVAAGELAREGSGRAARYRPARDGRWSFRYATAGLEEDRVWSELRARLPALGEVEGEARNILAYAFTEILNNAIDHSGAAAVEVTIERSGRTVGFEIADAGVGAYASVRARLGLATPLEALQELSKGKVTTQPERHSGEGLFFVSKAGSRFALESAGLVWRVDARRRDMAVGTAPARRGTRVRFELDLDRARPLRELFAEYTRDLAFTRTRTYVRLFAIGTSFLSRSEAKRLVSGLDRFQEAVLDFEGVEIVGQGFADEVFRVWGTAHPKTALVPVNMVEPVAFMVGRAQRAV